MKRRGEGNGREDKGLRVRAGKQKLPKGESSRRAAAARRKLGLLTREERIRAVQGKYAFIPFNSEDFIAEKAKEIDREQRKWRSS
jgi:hypothetical protein